MMRASLKKALANYNLYLKKLKKERGKRRQKRGDKGKQRGSKRKQKNSVAVLAQGSKLSNEAKAKQALFSLKAVLLSASQQKDGNKRRRATRGRTLQAEEEGDIAEVDKNTRRATSKTHQAAHNSSE